MHRVSDLALWSAPLLALFVTLGVSPGLFLRVFVRAYPVCHPRRHELIAEFAALPRRLRPLWVAQQAETALREGLPTRWHNRSRNGGTRRVSTRSALALSFGLWLLSIALLVPTLAHPETVSSAKLVTCVVSSCVSFLTWAMAVVISLLRKRRSQ